MSGPGGMVEEGQGGLKPALGHLGDAKPGEKARSMTFDQVTVRDLEKLATVINERMSRRIDRPVDWKDVVALAIGATFSSVKLNLADPVYWVKGLETSAHVRKFAEQVWFENRQGGFRFVK